MLKDLSWKNNEIHWSIEVNKLFQALSVLFFFATFSLLYFNHSHGASMVKHVKL